MTLPDPTTKIQYSENNIYGSAVYMGRRTAAHLDRTRERAQANFDSDVLIIQGAFNTSVEASAGTHDYDACLDIYIPGVAWLEQQRFLRWNGWAAWWRYPPSFGHHIHMISLGYPPARVGIYVPGQVDDYRNGRTGLAGHYADNTWHPENIDQTIFDYAAWMSGDQEDDDMNADDKEWLKAQFDRMAKLVNTRGANSAERDKAATDRDVRQSQLIVNQFNQLEAEIDEAVRSGDAKVVGQLKDKVATARKTVVEAVEREANMVKDEISGQ